MVGALFLKASAKNTEIVTTPALRLYDDGWKGRRCKNETKSAHNKS
jgi:hypothetical protein